MKSNNSLSKWRIEVLGGANNEEKHRRRPDFSHRGRKKKFSAKTNSTPVIKRGLGEIA